jgi:hypothetical protein
LHFATVIPPAELTQIPIQMFAAELVIVGNAKAKCGGPFDCVAHKVP